MKSDEKITMYIVKEVIPMDNVTILHSPALLRSFASARRYGFGITSEDSNSRCLHQIHCLCFLSSSCYLFPLRSEFQR